MPSNPLDDDFDINDVDIEFLQSDQFEQHTEGRRAPKFHVAKRPGDKRRVRIIHADSTELTLEQEEDADNEFIAGWVNFALFFGEGGLYVGFSADRAEELGKAFIRAAEELRSVEAEHARESESID